MFLRFREGALGLRPTDQLLFYGLKISGPNLIVEGPMYSELNFLFHSGAPKYYEQATGQGAAGWILFSDFMFQFINAAPEFKNRNFLGFWALL